ncbi:hypothetical protein IVB34_35860 [Bradyrhizobium sp. 2]|uniref:hypothetical protein n=1 Tax=unclassified Bradyrhizobium TaxID=2631580 RepID=UPI001FF80250|nr:MULTISPECIES: hypothetical protein [unclassified Bradyrhizobium]MCK1447893.1 hypothetical protein [Bradyrhizobium sp. 48]MCK1463585.1 hypothetical protein [Bradyrhizobium sp. 2]
MPKPAKKAAKKAAPKEAAKKVAEKTAKKAARQVNRAKKIIQKPITIDIEVLESVHAMTEDKARETIGQTRSVRINEDTPKNQKITVTVEPENQRITMEAPTDIGDGLLFIDLIDERGAPMATLAYDLKAGEFRQPVREPEASPLTDLQRVFELALRIVKGRDQGVLGT